VSKKQIMRIFNNYLVIAGWEFESAVKRAVNVISACRINGNTDRIQEQKKVL
jgi:hypothetical protein